MPPIKIAPYHVAQRIVTIVIHIGRLYSKFARRLPAVAPVKDLPLILGPAAPGR